MARTRQGRFLGLPWDWRRPTARRAKERMWNAGDDRILTPKSFGWGYTVNFRALVKLLTRR